MDWKDTRDMLNQIKNLAEAGLIKWTKLPFKGENGAEIETAMGYHGEVTDWSFTIASFTIPETGEIGFDGASTNPRKGLVLHLTPELSKLLAEQAEEKTR
jgi:hypothetical protein